MVQSFASLQIKLDVIKPVLSDRDFNKHSIGIMLEQFTATCKIHTSVMMYKYQLEQYILMKDSDDHLYTITATLQETVNLLETIEVMILSYIYMDNNKWYTYYFTGVYLRTSLCRVYSRTIPDDIHFTL